MPVSEEQAVLSWDRALRADVLNGGKVLIRHTQESIANASWKDSVQIVEAASGNQTQKIVPLLPGTYSIKFETVGATPRRSALASFTQAEIPSTTFLIAQTINEHSLFLGAKSNVVHDTNVAGYNGLVLDSASLFDNVPNLDLVTNLDSLGNVEPEGTYDFANIFNLGYKHTARISRILSTVGYVADDVLDNVPNIDSLVLFDGISGEDVNAKLYLKSSDTGLDFNSKNWQEVTNNFVTGQYFQFQARLTSANPDENIIVTELGALVELAARVESGAGTSTVGPAVDTVLFANRFYQTPEVIVNITNMQTGDFAVVSAPAANGFHLEIKNASGARVTRSFTYNAFGYGKAI